MSDQLNFTEIKNIVEELSTKYNTPRYLINKMILNVFRFVKNSIYEGVTDEIDTFKNIRIYGFGIFCIRTKYFNHVKGKKKEKELIRKAMKNIKENNPIL